MIEFPKTAAFGKRITVAQLKKQGLKASLAESIKALTWSYKLSPETMQLAPTDSVKEIEVLDLVLKEKCSTSRAMAALISAIDGLIPSPLLFRVHSEVGNHLGLMFNLKASGGALHGTSDVFRLFKSEEDIPLPTGVTSLESFVKAIAAACAGMAQRPDESLRGLEERHYQLESLKADRQDVEKKLAKEKQLDAKYQLAKDQKKLEKEIEKCLK